MSALTKTKSEKTISGRTISEPEEPRLQPAGTVFKPNELDRRQFLNAGGGFLLACVLEAGGRPARAQQSFGGGINSLDESGLDPVTMNAYVRINTDNTVTIFVGGGEMGQGIFSGLAQGVAEELMVDWKQVKIESIPAALSWLTAGSSGVVRHLTPMRTAGAAAREMLITAAAQTWRIPKTACRAASGMVINTRTNASFSYGYLAPLAALLPVPTNPPLTAPANYRILGTPVARPDLPPKTDGSAMYGIDIRLPGMLYAVIKNAPSLGATLNGTPPVPSGALAVVPLGNAVAVIATNTWQAQQAAGQLQARWSTPSSAVGVDSALYATQAQQLMASGAAYTAEQSGNVSGALAGAARVLQMTYSLPYLAHACMEVVNCTVSATPTSCEIWAPTQAPASVLQTAIKVTHLPASQITIHPTLMGGGLGRKFEQDYIAQAIQTSMALGKPVKLTWMREEDFMHDQYRPMALSQIQVGLDASNNITAWYNRQVSPSILAQRGVVLGPTGDSQATEGMTALPYTFGSRLVEYVPHTATVPVGFWRSVGHSINAFAVESAIDEVALAISADPLTLRQNLLAGNARCLAVLNAAAALGRWGTALPTGHARGIAFAVAFGSLVAEVAEISQPAAGSIKVHKVACVIDCGTAINPDSIEAQMQGGIFHGLSAALWGQITFKAGRASVSNWSHYRVLKISEAPVISVQILQSGAATGGVGEPGVPPIAPAVANAYAKLTGQRVRSLPFFPGATMGGG